MQEKNFRLRTRDWNYQPERKALWRAVQSQQYFLWIYAEYMPEHHHIVEAFCEKIDECAIRRQKYTGWKALAHEWVRFVNALREPTNNKLRYYELVKYLLEIMDAKAYSLHHRTLIISSTMLENCSFQESCREWERIWKRFPAVRILTADENVEFIAPDVLSVSEETITIDDEYFLDFFLQYGAEIASTRCTLFLPVPGSIEFEH